MFSSGSLDGAADGGVCGELALLELDTGVVTGRGLNSACAPRSAAGVGVPKGTRPYWTVEINAEA